MSVKRGVTSLALCGVLLTTGVTSVFADMTNVVTLGANLSKEQKETVLKYLGVKENEVTILEVTNAEEREYLEGVAPIEQIGTRTFSCAYVQPANPGNGIKVKTVNLRYVTSSMIASTLATCGVKNANVIAMSPIPVSGTGALTGVIKAFEDATGEKLDEEKKEIATEELVVIGDIANQVGPDKATGIVNDIKLEVIKENTKDNIQIAETIVNVTNNYNVTLTEQQKKDLEALMKKVADQEYEYSQIKDTLKEIGQTIEGKLEEIGESIDRGFWEDLKGTVSGWFESIGDWFSGLFNNTEEDLGILGQTNDQLLGDDVVVDATEAEAIETNTEVVNEKGFFEKIWDWFKGLFSSETTENGVDHKTDQTELESNTETNKPQETIIGGGESQLEENKEAEKEETNIDINNDKKEENNTSENTSDNIKTEQNLNETKDNTQTSTDLESQSLESSKNIEIKN